MGEINIKYQYPNDPNYFYETKLERINLDEERRISLATGKGFIISEPQSSLKKDLKNPNGIYSTRFGTTLQDINPFADRYKCQCGHFKSRIYNGITCPICKKKVRYVDDDFEFFGWIVLKDPYYIIHPNLYKSIDQLLGQNRQKQDIIQNILEPHEEKNQDGFVIDSVRNKEEPFYGIGMAQFKERFDEIMKYYLEKKKFKKQDYYDDIMNNRDKIFIQSIPVYTTQLRPFKVDGIEFRFEGTNAIYNIMVRLSVAINKDDTKMFRKVKTKNQLLFDLNNKYQELYKELENIISGKKGTIRSLFGGRYNFTSRDVIVPNPSLRIDEVTMPYIAMVELLQQTIINILQKSYNMSYSEAYRTWYMSKIVKNEVVYKIIKGLINSTVNNTECETHIVDYGDLSNRVSIEGRDNNGINNNTSKSNYTNSDRSRRGLEEQVIYNNSKGELDNNTSYNNSSDKERATETNSEANPDSGVWREQSFKNIQKCDGARGGFRVLKGIPVLINRNPTILEKRYTWGTR